MKWIGKWARKVQRSTDIRILWPACKGAANDVYVSNKDNALEAARQAFYLHCVMDRAWSEDMTANEIRDYVRRLV